MKNRGIVLGDVSGKGVSAALYMARLMNDIRHVSLIDPDPVVNLQDEQIGDEQIGVERIQSILLEFKGTPEGTLKKICETIHHFTGGSSQFDNMTFLMFKVANDSNNTQ